MQIATNRAPRAHPGAFVVGAPDPALGVGRALRSAFVCGDPKLPADFQALLDKLN